MNPGKVVAPRRVDEGLRLGAAWRPSAPATHFGYPEDEHSFRRAVLRCVGGGNCPSHSGGVRCPSYRATGEEERATRVRARLLFEMLDGHPDSAVKDGWCSTEVRDALDLFLACKSCKSDCPTGVDMATYKAEFLSHHYAGRLRPTPQTRRPPAPRCPRRPSGHRSGLAAVGAAVCTAGAALLRRRT